MNSHPKFAVVGHPNKGKSSIVASLALDDSIAISDTPGTTTKYRSFPLKVDGKVLYELFDTPGFQRARKIMQWLKSAGELSAMQRVQRLEEFVKEFEDDPKFNDDIELLKPILDGAGILYIVDASKPYGSEYEIQMQILSYTGQPSMAILNHIGDEDYSDEWKRVLHHYFKIVRTYNPMSATIDEHISILESIAQLREEWTPSIKESIEVFKEYHKSNIQKSADAIVEYVINSISYVLKKPQNSIDEDKLITLYQEHLKELEVKFQKKLEDIWNHKHLNKEIDNLEFKDIDLFSKQSASLFGLSQSDVVMMGIGSGAVTGAALDMLTVGHTLLLGGTIGAIVGGVGAYLGYDKASKTKLLGQPLAQKYISVGPMQSVNLAFVILNRAIYYALILKNLSHAKRDTISLDMDHTFSEQILTSKHKKELEKLHKKLRDSKEIDSKDISAYKDIILEILANS